MNFSKWGFFEIVSLIRLISKLIRLINKTGYFYYLFKQKMKLENGQNE